MLKRVVKALIAKSLRPAAGDADGKPALRTTPRLREASNGALDCSIAYNEFGGYCVPASSLHRPCAQAILAGEVYERETLSAIARGCKDGDIVHAGVYFGDFLPFLSGALSPGSLIWAFEPNRENFRCAEITILVNNLTNVRLANSALSANNGRLRIKTTRLDGIPLGGASRVSEHGDAETSAVTVDEAVPSERHVSVLQLDVEGHERFALAGAMDTIKRCKPMIVLETVPKDWISEHLAPLGYRATSITDWNTVYTA